MASQISSSSLEFELVICGCWVSVWIYKAHRWSVLSWLQEFTFRLFVCSGLWCLRFLFQFELFLCCCFVCLAASGSAGVNSSISISFRSLQQQTQRCPPPITSTTWPRRPRHTACGQPCTVNTPQQSERQQQQQARRRGLPAAGVPRRALHVIAVIKEGFGDAFSGFN